MPGQVTEPNMQAEGPVQLHRNQRKIIKQLINWKFLQITFNWRSKKSIWGRFGGGWNWKLGFQSSGRDLILNFLVFFLRIHFGKARA